MALTLDLDPKPTPKWISDRRLCLTADGTVCGADDPAGTTLLVAEGGQLELSVAVSLGLANPDGSTIPPAPAEEKKSKPASPTAPRPIAKPPAKPPGE
jgi:hypothetical protein